MTAKPAGRAAGQNGRIGHFAFRDPRGAGNPARAKTAESATLPPGAAWLPKIDFL
jgi:hypothetical protein